jgi:hypothetical protein
MRKFVFVVGLFACISLPPCLVAQEFGGRALFQGQTEVAHLPLPWHFTAADSVPRTHWVLGGAIGAVAIGLWTGIGFHDACEGNGGCQVALGGLGAAVGFVIGALIGGQFPYH